MNVRSELVSFNRGSLTCVYQSPGSNSPAYGPFSVSYNIFDLPGAVCTSSADLKMTCHLPHKPAASVMCVVRAPTTR